MTGRNHAARELAGLVLASLILVSACSPQRDASQAGKAGERIREAAHPIPASDPSLFELAFPLTDQDGRTRHLSEFRGAPFVASMVYTNCTSVCPRVTADLKRLEQALPEAERAHTRFVLFSLDPARDTPAALRAFAAEHALASERWTLLATSIDDMRTLAAVLGMRFRPESNGEVAHSALIVVVDSAGVIRHRQLGVTDDHAALLAAVRAAR